MHSSVDGHLGCVHVLVNVNSAAVNTGVCVSFRSLVFSKYMLRSGIAESYNLYLGFLRNLHAVLHSGCVSLHSHQQCRRQKGSLFSTACLAFVDFLMMGILTGVR